MRQPAAAEIGDTMLMNATDEGQFVDELDTNRIHAALVVGDNWVATVIAHVDRLGTVYPFRWRHTFLDVEGRDVPSPRVLQEAVYECWNGMGVDARVEYSRFFLSLPGWACRSREATSRCFIDRELGPRVSRPKVTAHDVQRLAERICTENISASYVVTDLVPHCYLGDSGTAHKDPIGATSATLLLQAHLVMADLSTVHTILDALRAMDVRVDVMSGPFCPMGTHLTAPERASGAVLVEVDRLNTYCSHFLGGQLVRSSQATGGVYDIVQSAASGLGIRMSDFAPWLGRLDTALVEAGPDVEIDLPPRRRRQPSGVRLGDVVAAAGEAAEDLLSRLDVTPEFSEQNLQRCLNKVVVMGDDHLTLRAMCEAFRRRHGVECEWRRPRKVHGNGRPPVPGFPRVVGLSRFGAVHNGRRQPYLEEYNETLMDALNRSVQEAALHAFDWISGRAGLSGAGTRKDAVSVPRSWLF